MRVILLPSAEVDIEGIGDYIAANNPARALTFIQGLRQQAENLSHFPLGHPHVRGYEPSGVRYTVYGRHLIIFRVIQDDESSVVHVLRVLHEAQDYLNILEL
ncbi:MAG: type II toxin-antitoxin system RelE/ParE family toxin [Propionibacteriaceae bacterium]|jgi:plasmid stabilization system protein ParE|nr:type II toxin-antitoxin system RelE/ParE family toxin [Propionibacteriaceae bacterium]